MAQRDEGLCPVCDETVEREYLPDESDRWTDVFLYYCEACKAASGDWPTAGHDSLALDMAIERMMEDRDYR